MVTKLNGYMRGRPVRAPGLQWLIAVAVVVGIWGSWNSPVQGAAAAQTVYLEVTVTNAVFGITNHNALTVDGDTRTATNITSINPTKYFQATNNMLRAKTNLYFHIAQFPFGNGPTRLGLQDVSTNKFRLIGRPDQTIAFTIVGDWGTGVLVTNAAGTNATQIMAPDNAAIEIYSGSVQTNAGNSIVKYIGKADVPLEPAWVALQHVVGRSNVQSLAHKTIHSSTNVGGETTNVNVRSAFLGGPTFYGIGNQGRIYFGTNNGPPWVGYFGPSTNGALGMFTTNDEPLQVSDSGGLEDPNLMTWLDYKTVGVSRDSFYFNIENLWTTINKWHSGTNLFSAHLAVHAGLYATGQVVKVETNFARVGAITNFNTVTAQAGTLHVSNELTSAASRQTNATLRGRTTIGGDLAFPSYVITSVADGDNVIDIGTNTYIVITGSPTAPWRLAAIAGGNRDGRRAWIYFKTGLDVTVLDQSGTTLSEATNRIVTLTGGSVISGGNGWGEIFYDGAAQRWVFGWINRGTAVSALGIDFASLITDGLLRSNHWQKIAPLQNANQGYVANTNTGDWSVILGGATNRIEPPWSVIGGGRNNRMLGSGTSNDVLVIAGGEDNLIELGNVKHAVIGGGQLNLVRGGASGARYGTIAGGWKNSIQESNSTIGGGYLNTNHVFNSIIGGGYSNVIVASDAASAPTSPQANVIGGGGGNYMAASYSVIAGGLNNKIRTNGSGTLEGNVIAGGLGNEVGGAYSSIVGGTLNLIGGNGGTSFIGGGSENVIDGGDGVNVIAGGYQNQAKGAFGFVGGGLVNIISAGDYSSIPGGQGNTISANSVHLIGDNLTGDEASTVQLGFSDASKFVVGLTSIVAQTPFFMSEVSEPSTPAANTGKLYFKDSGGATRLFYKSDNGTEYGPLDAPGAGASGDALFVNATAISDSASLSNTAASATEAATMWIVAPGADPDPDKITLGIGAASATEAGLMTAQSQTFGGAKTFAEMTLSSWLKVTGPVTNDGVSMLTGNIVGGANATLGGWLKVTGPVTNDGASVLTGDVTSAGTMTAAEFVGTGSGAGILTLTDDDQDRWIRLRPSGTTTTDSEIIWPAAPGGGFLFSTVSDTTNVNLSFVALSSFLSDTAFGGSWDGVTAVAPSKNAVYDELVLAQRGNNVLSNLVGTVGNNVTNVASGWGAHLVTAAGTLTAHATNAISLVASNATTVQADFTGGTPVYQSAHVMRTNLTIQLTNPVPGRVMTFHLRGDLDAVDRTVTLSTNGLTGDWPISWGFYCATNGATALTATNNMGAEINILVLSNRFSAFYSPVR